MTETYFLRTKGQTPTRLWVNNPTRAEIDLALAQGAVGCTTNPAFGGGLLKRAQDEIRPVIAECLSISNDNLIVADAVQLRLVQPAVERFREVYETSAGREGFVSIQGAPETDTDGDTILEEAHAARSLGPNATPKIPATRPGLRAFEQLVAEGSPTIVTEVFSLAQLITACDAYLKVSQQTGQRPPFFVSPITGIFGDHLKYVAEQAGIACDRSTIEWAGVAFARACNSVVETRGYPARLLFGGARVMNDFTGLVGSDTAATINYSTVEDILAVDPPVEDTIHQAVAPEILSGLTNKFADFRTAMVVDGLNVGEFAAFGPVQHFRNNFIDGRNSVLAAIAEARQQQVTPLGASALG